ncbi:hydantoinase/oxoprolinase [Sporothrix schenckii 1099-18]|uniref:Hydantoinase/oxoprolinase n=2 Tax=Sporothrix schenckii TaxID=29908 RepID=U7PH42_SPOS1|nr:hydantoinase/oxoprolinase [Sporothrix schenckii 1099-18]ERS94847.1 hypothetical protein HMPREF1624_08744 [Sporothrix schenckii ATCC 58251]KJR89006.1 hydantoinase/oxoprolinase [Sporothrix schenckii 1099-18]
MASLNRPVRIGIDVGGTNTDAVVLDPAQRAAPDRGVLAFHKTPTTHDATSGVVTALKAVLEASEINRSRIASVTVGTTAFLNAVIERNPRRLERVGVLRLSQSFLRDIPPLSDWPADLAALVRGYVGYVNGGLNIDGSEEAPIDESQVVRESRQFRAHGLQAIVVAGVYAPIDQTFHQEDRVRTILQRELPGVDVVCSHEVANIGFLERENAAILNAAILRFARRSIRQFEQALSNVGLANCPLYLTQNDGTVLDVAAASRVPIRTFSSGVTNSMRGAAYLAGLTRSAQAEQGSGGAVDLAGQAAIVVDMGGTTTDVGVLLPSGLPRPAATYVSVGGVSVNYALPHLHSIGLGGGSLVSLAKPDGPAVVGPASVGAHLERSLLFGGRTTTATDIAVAAGRARIASVSDVPATVTGLDRTLVDAVLERVGVMLSQAIDFVKTSPLPLPVLLTGGGSILAPGDIAGASEVIRPPFYDVANAVGAACSGVGVTVDTIRSISEKSTTEIKEEVAQLAVDRAVAQGAVRDSVYIAQVDAIPIPYLDNRMRFIVTSIGDLDLTAAAATASSQASQAGLIDVEAYTETEAEFQTTEEQGPSVTREDAVDVESYTPIVVRNKTTGVAEWLLTKADIDFLADGCYVLGCGGGGNPSAGRLQLQDLLDAGHRVRVVDAADVSAIADNAQVYWGGRMGSPAAIAERLQAHETVLAIRALMDYLRHDDLDAVVGLEIGGANGLEPLLWGSSRFFDRPVLDADFMGRANPMCWQTTLTVHQPGHFCPCAIDSGTGRTLLLTRAPRDEDVDRPLRGALSELGSLVGLAPAPTTGAAVRQFAVQRSLSLAWRIGRAIALSVARHDAVRAAETVIRELGGATSARILFRGKITSIERTLHKGLSVGVLHIAATFDDDEGDGRETSVATGGTLRIPFVNENILAEHVRDGADGSSKVIATVPDLIALLDRDNGKPVGVPEYRYGCHVVVLGIACSPRWTDTGRGIEIGGPHGYGYDIPYKPLGTFQEPHSVIQQYAPPK